MTTPPAVSAPEIADHYTPVFAILDLWDALGEVDPDPVPVTLGNGTVASMTRDWLTFPRADGAISGKSLSLNLLKQWRSAMTPPNHLTDEKDR